jgi:hypothetical protein
MFVSVFFSSISKQRVSVFRLNQNKQKTNRNSSIESIYWYFFIKFRVVSGCFGLFRFVSKHFVSVVLNSIPKQWVSMFRLNQNKQKTNRNSLIESIFWYFSENFGLFWFDLKQFCLFRLFRYRFETPKQTENFSFWFHETNRNTTETDLVSVCFGSKLAVWPIFILIWSARKSHYSLHRAPSPDPAS